MRSWDFLESPGSGLGFGPLVLRIRHRLSSHLPEEFPCKHRTGASLRVTLGRREGRANPRRFVVLTDNEVPGKASE